MRFLIYKLVKPFRFEIIISRELSDSQQLNEKVTLRKSDDRWTYIKMSDNRAKHVSPKVEM